MTNTNRFDLTARKSEKELAFLHDLFVAPDWGERFAELIDEHLQLPSEGKAAYIGAGTGAHSLALQERAGRNLTLVGIDENPEAVELARAKARATLEESEFRVGKIDHLGLPDNEFDLVVGNASLVVRQRVPKMFSEIVRIAAPGAVIALTLPTASSFGEFFSIYWEALHNLGMVDLESQVMDLIRELPSITAIEEMAEEESLEEVNSWTSSKEFSYDSGEQFLGTPLVADFLMQDWLAAVPEESRGRLSQEISRLINEERHGTEFLLSVKATLVVGRKTRSH